MLFYFSFYKFISANKYLLTYLLTNHTLIDITESIKKAIDNKAFACGVFVDLQKAFDTVDHQLLLAKLKYYGVRGIPLEWFRSYLTNRSQFVKINGKQSLIKTLSFGVPQGSILGLLLFLIYINDLHTCIKYARTYHFADDTNLLTFNSSLKKLNKQVNTDLTLLVNWLRSNKISLNTKMTELIIFKSKTKQITKRLNFRISGQRLTPVNCIKYLGVKIDQNLYFSSHIADLTLKLSRSNGMLAKIRHYVNKETLLSIYHAIFSSHLMYGCQIWGNSSNLCTNKIISLQNKAMRIIHFQNSRTNADLLYYISNILKIQDQIKFLNCQFVWDQLHDNLPPTFESIFKLRSSVHNRTLRSTTANNLSIPKIRTQLYGYKSLTVQSILSWNALPTDLKLLNKSRASFASSLKSNFLSHYD